MNVFIAAALNAFWLGILTSISPCPMATNIAAISFVSKKIDKPVYVLYTGLLYTIGRTIAYISFGFLIVQGLLMAPGLSNWLQKYMHKLLGPIFIVVAMILLKLITINTKGSNIGQWCQNRADKFGLGGALLLGILFAVSFCPVSAALFFGTLIPLSVKYSSGFILPLIYGIGTAIPVLIFSIFLSTGVNTLGKAFQRITQFEVWARRITGIIFLVIGIYFTLIYTIGLRF